MDPGGAAPPAPGAAPGASSSPSAWSAAWGGGRRVYGACHGNLCALPCRMLVAASLLSAGAAACTACHARCSRIPRLCSTCPHTGGIWSAPWPLAPGGAAPTSEWRPPPLVRRAGWPVAPCVAPVCGPGPPHRGLVSRARARDSGWHRAARLLAATFASAWSRFGGRACPSIAGRGRPVATGTLRSGPPAGALGRRGAPLPATPPASPPGRCPSA